MDSSLGLNMESKEDSEEDSKEKVTNWGFIFMMLKNRGFSHEEILNLSYPQFNAYMNSINDPLTYSVVVPYMGAGEDDNEKEKSYKASDKLSGKEELMGIIASMNQDFL